MRSVSVTLSAIASLLISAVLIFAQSDLSTITGTIKDPSGSAVPNAKLPATATITVAQPPRGAGSAMRILKEAADIPVPLQFTNYR